MQHQGYLWPILGSKTENFERKGLKIDSFTILMVDKLVQGIPGMKGTSMVVPGLTFTG